ncbi:hypothetical protein [Streptomyces sp. 6N223]|uniref:hypothetical protein n=1 Tax=Streptomyces sp. 6N223 TaxID=3457412 RepID=UPI003FD4F850
MLPRALAQLAADAGTAMADAAGTGRWEPFGRRVAAWFARWAGGDAPPDAGATRAEAWTARVAAALEGLAEDERERAAAELAALLAAGTAESAPGPRHTVAAAGDMRVSARGGGVAAGVVQGDVTLGHPRMPAPPQG